MLTKGVANNQFVINRDALLNQVPSVSKSVDQTTYANQVDDAAWNGKKINSKTNQDGNNKQEELDPHAKQGEIGAAESKDRNIDSPKRVLV